MAAQRSFQPEEEPEAERVASGTELVEPEGFTPQAQQSAVLSTQPAIDTLSVLQKEQTEVSR